MPENLKGTRIKRNSLLTLLLAAFFVIGFILILIYTYNSLFQSAKAETLNAATTAATSLSRTIQTDKAQVDVIASDIMIKGVNSTYPEETKQYLKENAPDNSYLYAFIYPDGTYITSLDYSGKIDNMEVFKENLISSEIFVTNAMNELSGDYACYYRIITINDEFKGYLIGAYDYTKLLENSYAKEKTNKSIHNVMFTDNGEILFKTNVKGTEFEKVTNLVNFIKKNQYDGELPITSEPVINTFISDTFKYVIAIAPIDGMDNLNIARVLPSSVLFESTGKLLILLTVGSLLFFFLITIVAYRYYKSVTENSNRIKDVAYTDPLTGYSNFAKFKEDAEEILSEAGSKTYYICCVDMVGFRYINDAFGYDAGDEVLIAISNEINDLTSDEDVFCRVTGDKFVILTQRNYSDTENDMFIYQLGERITSIGPLAKSHIRLEVQMGVYKILPEDIEELSINALYDRALVALYSIEHTDTAVAFYDVDIYNEQLERKDIESRMHQALKDGEFRVYVQPKYRTSNAKLAAGEALIRWVDPKKGIVPPIKFIPLFEQNRFVHDVDLYVMEVIARFQRMRLNEGLPVVPISLNISPVELTMPGFRESYINIKKKYDIPDKLIELEFTEGIFFDDEELFKDVIREFHDNGFTCSMDDFGSGYSSLNILKDLPVDVLKLDKLFFRESDNTSRDRSIIRSVVAMARSLNIKTVAEGVETLDVVDFLRLIGCTLIQGYIYSKPLPLTEFEEKLNSEEVDDDDEFELDFDKFEVVPLDMPLSNSIDSTLRRTYAAIIEINAGGNIYHIYYPGESDKKFETIPERGFYASFYEDFIPKYVHPKDIENVKTQLNTMNLINHFKTNNELDIEYRHIRKDGSYSWMKLHVIKASGGRADSQIFFGYFNIIDDYKEAEENLSVAQNRFTAAYINFNGVVFELDLPSGRVDILEAHSDIFKGVGDVHEYEQFFAFVKGYLLHPDYQSIFDGYCTLEYIRSHFIGGANQSPLEIELQAKSSRKVTSYSFYRATYAPQADPNKLLLTVEDITSDKVKEADSEMRHHITDVAFANAYETVSIVNLDKDLFTVATYPPHGRKKANVQEGKYTLFMQSKLETFIHPDDRDNLLQIISIEGLTNFYNDSTTNEFKVIYRERAGQNDPRYVWKETLLVSAPAYYGHDRQIYMFVRSIDDIRVAEQNINEFAHRLSYSLAMFDYAYTVNCDDEHVTIIGGLKFETELFGATEISYQDVTTLVKNNEIAEEEQAMFRRLTYLDELYEHFQTHPATLTRAFGALDSQDKIVEVSIIYGARERTITFFFREIDKSLLTSGQIDIVN